MRSVVKTVKEMRLDECLRLYILHPVLKKVILQIMIGEISLQCIQHRRRKTKAKQGYANIDSGPAC